MSHYIDLAQIFINKSERSLEAIRASHPELAEGLRQNLDLLSARQNSLRDQALGMGRPQEDLGVLPIVVGVGVVGAAVLGWLGFRQFQDAQNESRRLAIIEEYLKRGGDPNKIDALLSKVSGDAHLLNIALMGAIGALLYINLNN